MNFTMATGRLNPSDPHDQKIIAANLLVHDWMKDPVNLSYLNELKAEALHEKGRSVGNNLRQKHVIPQDAWLMLPEEIRKSKKKRDQWLTEFHPYLFISK